jgi:TonB family protein
LGGLFASLLFPFFTVRYSVNVPAYHSVETSEVLVGQPQVAIADVPWWGTWLWVLYGMGVLVFLVRLVWQIILVYRVASRSVIQSDGICKVVFTNVFSASFTCFSYVYINPSLSELERREIIKHEAVHVLQRHWMDLVLAETVLLMQWFNPLAWIYIRFIKQNHEFLADRQVLVNADEPAVYKAVLLNQMMGGEVLRLSHQFNYSLNKKRFKMMNHTVISSWRKLRVLFALPVIAILFVAFAKPVYQYDENFQNSSSSLKAGDSIPQLNGADNLTEDKNMLILLDGKEIDMKTMKAIDSNSIAKIEVFKDDSQTSTYGSKAKNGVIIITSKSNTVLDGVVVVGYGDNDGVGGNSQSIGNGEAGKNEDSKVYVMVDQMPQFPGGQDALNRFVATNIRYPEAAQKNKSQGKVFVSFVVNQSGRVEKAKVIRSISPLLDEEALRIVNLFPDWMPGKQNGKNVDVQYTLPISFVLQ